MQSLWIDGLQYLSYSVIYEPLSTGFRNLTVVLKVEVVDGNSFHQLAAAPAYSASVSQGHGCQLLRHQYSKLHGSGRTYIPLLLRVHQGASWFLNRLVHILENNTNVLRNLQYRMNIKAHVRSIVLFVRVHKARIRAGLSRIAKTGKPILR